MLYFRFLQFKLLQLIQAKLSNILFSIAVCPQAIQTSKVNCLLVW